MVSYFQMKEGFEYFLLIKSNSKRLLEYSKQRKCVLEFLIAVLSCANFGQCFLGPKKDEQRCQQVAGG